MNNKKHFVIATIAAIAIFPTTFYGADTGGDFLKITPGALPQGLAGATAALSGDVQYADVNPAGDVGAQGMEAAFTHIALVQQNQLENIMFAHDAFGGRMVYGLTYLHYGELDGRDISGNETGSFTAYDSALRVGYAKSFGKLSLGAAVKCVHSSIDNDSGTGYGFDAGAIYDFGAFKMGAAVTNVGKAGAIGTENADLPATASVGIATTIKNITVSADYQRDIPENDTVLAGGAQLPLWKIFALRAGYLRDITNNSDIPNQNMNGLNAGFGVTISQFQIDYAYTSQGELGNTNRFTIAMKL
jgi:hypothetical protein